MLNGASKRKITNDQPEASSSHSILPFDESLETSSTELILSPHAVKMIRLTKHSQGLDMTTSPATPAEVRSPGKTNRTGEDSTALVHISNLPEDVSILLL